jgi:hypothetical protein
MLFVQDDSMLSVQDDCLLSVTEDCMINHAPCHFHFTIQSHNLNFVCAFSSPTHAQQIPVRRH